MSPLVDFGSFCRYGCRSLLSCTLLQDQATVGSALCLSSRRTAHQHPAVCKMLLLLLSKKHFRQDASATWCNKPLTANQAPSKSWHVMGHLHSAMVLRQFVSLKA